MSQPFWREVFLESSLRNQALGLTRLSLRPQSQVSDVMRRFFMVAKKLLAAVRSYNFTLLYQLREKLRSSLHALQSPEAVALHVPFSSRGYL